MPQSHQHEEQATREIESQRLRSGMRARVSRTNLETPSQRIVGRRGEVDALRSLSHRERHVSVVGAAGVGKTRFVQECALRMLDEYLSEGGVWCVDLAEAKGQDGVLSAVARALRVAPLFGEADAMAQLGAAIAARGRLLVIFDNADAVADEVARATAQWSRAARDARWIVAARARLDAEGEAIFDLGPLSFHPHAAAPGELAISDAGRLFVERAKAVREDFSLHVEDTPALAQLVRHLDGNALAIELAAACARERSIAEILARVVQEIDALVTGGARRAHPRHVALRAAIMVAYSELDADERAMLAQASVFAGGFDREAAAAVLRGADVDAALEALAKRGLVQRAGDRRYALHPSVRDFAQEKLETSGAQRNESRIPPGVQGGEAHHLDDQQGARDSVIARHARHYVALADRLREQASGPDARDAAIQLADESANLAAVHRRGNPVQALSVALALGDALERAGTTAQSFALLDEAIARAANDAPTPLAALAHAARADAHLALGRTAEARADYEKASLLAEKSGDAAARGRALVGLAAVDLVSGLPASARDHASGALSVLSSSRDAALVARALARLARANLAEGEAERGEEALERAVQSAEACGDARYVAELLCARAKLAHDRGELARARELCEAAAAGAQAEGDDAIEALALGLLAVVAHEEGKRDDADALSARALEIYGTAGDRRAHGAMLGQVARFRVEAGDLEDARLGFARALLFLRACDDRVTEGRVLTGLAALEALEGSIDSARAALHRATECLRGRPRDLAVVEIARGHIELALARAAVRSGEEARATMYLDAVRNRLTDASTPLSADARITIAGLRRALEAHERGDPLPTRSSEPASLDAIPEGFPAEALLVCARGRWFRAPHGASVPIDRWQALQNLVVKLAERREIAPGESLSVEDLVAAGWPGERILPKAGATRVYTALSTLRRLGLREVLVRGGKGYMLKPNVPLVRVSGRR
jgi:predicted ATPase